MTNEQQKAALKLKAQARLRLKSNGAASVGSNDGIGDALTFGLDSMGRSVGQGIQSLGELTGSQTIQDVGKAQAASNQADIDRRRYSRPEGSDGIVKNVKEGDFLDAASSLGYGALESGPSIATGAAASVAAMVGGIPALVAAGGATALGAIASLGSIRQEKKDKGLDETASLTDAGAAAASAAVELIPFGGKAAKIGLGLVKEGVQEGVQEGTTIGAVAAQGGSYTPTETVERIGDAAITGGVVSKGLDATVRAPVALAQAGAKAVGGIRTDNRTFTPDEVAAAELLRKVSDGNPDLLKTVNTQDAQTSAQGRAKAALKSLRADEKNIAKNLRKMAKLSGNDEAYTAVDTLIAEGGDRTTANTQAAITNVERLFPGEADVQRLKSIHNQMSAIQGFTQSDGDMGGFSKLTRYADPLDGRNSGLGKSITTFGGIGYGVSAPAIAINRVARVIDNVTNNRSRINRFVESAEKSGVKPTNITGLSSGENLAMMQQQEKDLKATLALAKEERIKKERLGLEAEKRQEKEVADFQRQEMRGYKQDPRATSKVPAEGSSLNQSNAGVEANADRFRMNAKATQGMFETGEIPKNDPYFTGYRLWNEATGLNPTDTADALEQLEREGEVPKGTTQRYAEDIYSFKKDKNAASIQRIVRDRANPGYEPKFTEKEDDILRKLDATSVKPGKSNSAYKKAEGQRRATNVVAQIEGRSNSVSPSVYKALYSLKDAMDNQFTTIDQRYDLMNETLPQLFPNPVELEMWQKVFTPLAAIGNDRPMKSKYDEEVEAVEAFDAKVEEVKKRSKKKKKADSPEPKPTVKTEDQLIAEVNNPTTKVEETSIDDGTTAVTGTEPKPALDQYQARGRTSVATTVNDRIQHIEDTVRLAQEKGGELAQHIASLGKSTEDRIETLIYEAATDQLTVNMLADSFASKFGVPPTDAARIVFDTLRSWEDQGLVKLYQMKGQGALKANGGEYQKGSDDRYLAAIQIDFMDEGLANGVEIAKAINTSLRIVSQDGPRVLFAPDRLKDGVFAALKDYEGDTVDGTFSPLLNFLNDMRMQKVGIQTEMLDQIDAALKEMARDPKRGNTVGTEIFPVVGTRIETSEKGVQKRVPIRDNGPLRAVAQLLQQLRNPQKPKGSQIGQEWGADDRGRIYSKNGMAHTQGGDLMKGLARTDQKYKTGGDGSLKMMFHSFGNLLGFDKKAPSVRREAIFQAGKIEALMAFADDPFGRNVTKNENIAGMLKDGEGFFQVLNVATEVNNMVKFARARHKDKGSKSPRALLKDPKVQADLAANYETDFFVQLDASNNAYQIVGLLMGYQEVLQATGLQPREGIDPDSEAGADIYLDPAKAVIQRIPELVSLGLPDSKVRKLFKKAIGTYLYSAADQSRKESFRQELETIADGANIVGINGDGLIEIPSDMLAGLYSEAGHTFNDNHYNRAGEVEVRVKRKKIEKAGEKWIITTDDSVSGGKFKKSTKAFNSKQDAARFVFESNLLGRMNREMIRDFEMRYPEVRQYLEFSRVLSELAKSQDIGEINIPTPDGIPLKFSFKEKNAYEGVPVQMKDREVLNPDGTTSIKPGKVLNMGVRTPEYKLGGRGLASFIAHSHDAYVLRETYRRMKEKGIKSFNPIHDSFGFHPSDAEAGQATALEVMQELGNENYNVFLNILQANGEALGLKAFLAKGGVLPQRKGVKPQPVQRIPTALS